LPPISRAIKRSVPWRSPQPGRRRSASLSSKGETA
jgi:hypothetical protein